MEGLTIGKEWKAERGDKSTAQASLSALILQGKHLAVIAAGVGTNPFDQIEASRGCAEEDEVKSCFTPDPLNPALLGPEL